jgi:sugar phosphate isomerase/epimerase
MSEAFAVGYNTNSLADHPLADALALIADQGYAAVALTIGYPHVRPFDADLGSQLGAIRALLGTHGLRVAVETGARYLLDPRNKHKPSLVDISAEPRIEFMRRAIDIAADIGATCVSLWSGYAVSHSDPDTTRDLLLGRLAQVVDYADRKAVTLGFEPEPGMFIETVQQVRDVCRALGDPPRLGVTLDVGHCVMTESAGAQTAIPELGDKLVNVHLDDMTPHKHEHLEFGQGDLDLGAVMDALRGSGFGGVASVELPRHSHDAPNVLRRSMCAINMARLPAAARSWVDTATAEVSGSPEAILDVFPGAARAVAKASAVGEDAALRARVKLLGTLVAAAGDETAAALIEKLYRWGDTDERLAVLRGLETSALDGQLGPIACATGVGLAQDALRCNDPRLVTAALGGFGAKFLTQHDWRHGVMKLVFMDVPLERVAGLRIRADAELARMATDYISERCAAGRSVSADVEMLRDLPAKTPEVSR